MFKKVKDKKIRIILILACALILFMGASFAWLGIKLTGNNNVLKAGTLSLYLDESSTEGINIEYAIPMSDNKGLSQEGYTFKLVNDGAVATNYTIYLDDLALEEDETRMPDSVVKYSLTKNGEQGETTLLTAIGENPQRIVDLGTIEPNTTNTYTLKLWMDYNATNEVMDTVFFAKLRVEAEQQNIKTDKTDMVMEVTDTDKQFEISDNISNYKITSSDQSVAIFDESTGYIIPRSHGIVTFTLQSIATGEKKEITVTINKTINIVYKKQDGISSVDKETDKCVLTDKDVNSCTVTLPNVETSPGYDMLGWYNGEVRVGSEADSFTTTEDVELLAKSNTVNYSFKVNLSEGIESFDITQSDGTTLNNQISYTTDSLYEDEFTISNIKVKTGYTYTNYSLSEGLTEGSDSSKETIKVKLGATDGIVTINSKINSYKVTYDATTNGGTTTATTATVDYNSEIDLSQVAEKEGFEFVGWNTDKDATTALSSLTMETADVTLYAIYAKKVTITFNKNGAISQSVNGTTSTEDILEVSCTLHNNGKCKVTSPSIAASTATPTVIGYSTAADDHTSSWDVSVEKEVTKDATYYAQTKQPEATKSATYESQGVGVKQLTTTADSCTIDATYNGEAQETSCKVKLATFEVLEGYTAIGWNANKDAITGVETDEDGNIVLNESTTTYYTISRKDEITLKATFNKNGAASQTVKGGTASTAATVEVSCKLPAVYNTTTQATECDITTPTIEASTATPTIVGYATSGDATTASVQPNTNLTLTGNATYYAITKSEVKTYTATFNLNGASKLTNSEGTEVAEAVTRTCNIPVTYNGESQATSCEITTPTITASTATPTVCGFTTSTTGTSTCTVKHNSTQNLTADIEYYAQTYKAKTTKSVAFKIAASSNVSKITSGSTSVTNTTDSITLTCDIAAVYNGATQATSCNVTSPTITPATGYKSAFWGTSTSSTSGTTSGGSVSSTTSTYYARALTGNSYTVNYYDGSTLKGSSTATVGTSFTLKTASSLGLSKTGYTFKGWATTSGSTTVAHTDGKSVSNLTTTDGGTVSLYAVWKDETAVSCSWSTSGTITTGNTTTLTLTCTDTGSGLSSQTLGTSNFSVSSTTYGSVTAVSAPTAVTNGYKYTVTVKGLSSGSTATTNGSFTVSLNANSIKDGASNYNVKTTSSAVTVTGRSYTATFTKQGTGVTSIGSNSLGCTSVGTATTCNVTLPTITVSSGYTAVGWSTSSTSTTGTVAGTSVTLSANAKYYSISYKNAITLSATWNANGATLSSTTTSTCELAKAYNSNTQATSCTVEAPTITRSGYTIVGFNTSSSATTSSLSSGGTLTLTSSNTGKTWYAITYKTITITFKLNGASKLTNASGTAVASDVTRTCTMYNTATSCSVTSPTITASTNTPSIYGYSTAAATHSNGWSVNTAKSVSANATWYAQTYKSAVTRTLSYTKGTGVSSISRTTPDTCQIAATYNGSAQGTSCSITTTLPSITASANYVTLGWYNGTTKVANSGASYTVSLSSNLTLTAKAQAAVAKNVIGSTTTYYLSLQEAVSAASTTTPTVTTLLQNTTENIEVKSTVDSININLDGKTVTGTINNNAYLTVRNGTINNSGTALTNWGGTMILNGLSVSSNGPGAIYVIYNKDGGLLSITGSVTTNSVSTTHYTVALYNDAGSTANIDGLTVESASNSYGVVNHGGTVNMSNSYINTTGYWPYLNRNNGTSTLKSCTIANTNPNSYVNESGTSTLYDVTIPATVSGKVIRYQYVGSGHARISLYGHTGLYTNVYMPTWTVNNEQDDVQWYLATIASDSTGSYHYYDIYSSNHNNELGPFHTHIYTRNTSTGAAETYLAGISYNIQHY